jgi:outer membrane protein assembly factor BamD (BamD/ComL family)
VESIRPQPAIGAAESQAAELVEALFKKGDYRLALAEAKKLRSGSGAGSADRDVADFVAGACNYYLGRFQEAQPLLDSHVKQFGGSRHRESALYYQASNRVRLLQWRVAGGMLDRYISAYPESLLLEFALFDRATCHSGLGEGDRCLQVLERLERQFIYSKIRDRALALKGDVLKDAGDLAGAQASYLKAQEAAEELKHPELDARCLANLTAVAAARGQNDLAIKYYNTFFAKYPTSRYASKAALGGMPALLATGDGDSGLEKLERLMQAMPESTEASVIKDTLVEYSRYYREQNGSDQLLRRLGDLSSTPEGSQRLKEQLLIARLEALETYFPDRVAEIRVYYRQMRDRFKPSDLSAANVLKMADYIAEDDPAGAITWYQNALARGGTRHRASATLGLAKANAANGDDRAAETGFRSVLETFGSPELAEEATLGLARIAGRNTDWNASAQFWSSYLDHSDWNLAKEEARDALALARSQGGRAKLQAPSSPVPDRTADSNNPLAQELAKAESLAAAGKKVDAYDSLDRMLRRIGPVEKLPKTSAVQVRKAQMMHEDLGIELGR